MHKLYGNIGKKIKTFAFISFLVEAISMVITGFCIALVFLLDGDEYFVNGLALMLFGPPIAFVGSWLLYGFGELIEQTTISATYLSRLNTIVSQSPLSKQQTAPTSSPQNEPVTKPTAQEPIQPKFTAQKPIQPKPAIPIETQETILKDYRAGKITREECNRKIDALKAVQNADAPPRTAAPHIFDDLTRDLYKDYQNGLISFDEYKEKYNAMVNSAIEKEKDSENHTAP